MESKVVSRLSRLNITIVCPPDETGTQLVRAIQRTRATVERRWPHPERLGEGCDILVSDFFVGIERKYPWDPGEATAAVVLLLPAGGEPPIDALHAALPDALLSRPLHPTTVIPALSLAWDHFSFHRRQTSRIIQLEESIRSLREVERAKTILMQERNLNEINAFEALRAEAMERRMKISALAKWIVDSRDFHA